MIDEEKKKEVLVIENTENRSMIENLFNYIDSRRNAKNESRLEFRSDNAGNVHVISSLLFTGTIETTGAYHEEKSYALKNAAITIEIPGNSDKFENAIFHILNNNRVDDANASIKEYGDNIDNIYISAQEISKFIFTEKPQGLSNAQFIREWNRRPVEESQEEAKERGDILAEFFYKLPEYLPDYGNWQARGINNNCRLCYSDNRNAVLTISPFKRNENDIINVFLRDSEGKINIMHFPISDLDKTISAVATEIRNADNILHIEPSDMMYYLQKNNMTELTGDSFADISEKADITLSGYVIDTPYGENGTVFEMKNATLSCNISYKNGHEVISYIIKNEDGTKFETSPFASLALEEDGIDSSDGSVPSFEDIKLFLKENPYHKTTESERLINILAAQMKARGKKFSIVKEKKSFSIETEHGNYLKFPFADVSGNPDLFITLPSNKSLFGTNINDSCKTNDFDEIIRKIDIIEGTDESRVMIDSKKLITLLDKSNTLYYDSEASREYSERLYKSSLKFSGIVYHLHESTNIENGNIYCYDRTGIDGGENLFNVNDPEPIFELPNHEYKFLGTNPILEVERSYLQELERLSKLYKEYSFEEVEKMIVNSKNGGVADFVNKDGKPILFYDKPVSGHFIKDSRSLNNTEFKNARLGIVLGNDDRKELYIDYISEGELKYNYINEKDSIRINTDILNNESRHISFDYNKDRVKINEAIRDSDKKTLKEMTRKLAEYMKSKGRKVSFLPGDDNTYITTPEGAHLSIHIQHNNTSNDMALFAKIDLNEKRAKELQVRKSVLIPFNLENMDELLKKIDIWNGVDPDTVLISNDRFIDWLKKEYHKGGFIPAAPENHIQDMKWDYKWMEDAQQWSYPLSHYYPLKSVTNYSGIIYDISNESDSMILPAATPFKDEAVTSIEWNFNLQTIPDEYNENDFKKPSHRLQSGNLIEIPKADILKAIDKRKEITRTFKQIDLYGMMTPDNIVKEIDKGGNASYWLNIPVSGMIRNETYPLIFNDAKLGIRFDYSKLDAGYGERWDSRQILKIIEVENGRYHDFSEAPCLKPVEINEPAWRNETRTLADLTNTPTAITFEHEKMGEDLIFLKNILSKMNPDDEFTLMSAANPANSFLVSKKDNLIISLDSNYVDIFKLGKDSVTFHQEIAYTRDEKGKSNIDIKKVQEVFDSKDNRKNNLDSLELKDQTPSKAQRRSSKHDRGGR